MKAMDVMIHDVVTVKADDDVADAIKLLAEHDVSALPVVDEAGAVIGVLSEADLMRREEIGTAKHRAWWLEAMTSSTTLAGEFAKANGRKVGEVMSDTVISASEETPIDEIANLLEKHRIKRVPILRDGRLVGIVSRSNLIQALASSQVPASGDVPSDRAIRVEVLKQLGAQPWTDFGSRNIIVRDGVVNLWGLVGSPEERTALVALAEQVPGVKNVEDETFPAY